MIPYHEDEFEMYGGDPVAQCLGGVHLRGAPGPTYLHMP